MNAQEILQQQDDLGRMWDRGFEWGRDSGKRLMLENLRSLASSYTYGGTVDRPKGIAPEHWKVIEDFMLEVEKAHVKGEL